MRIAFVHPSLASARGDSTMKKGGSENALVWLADELSRRGHDVHVYVAAYSDEAYGLREDHRFVVHEIGGPEWRPSNLVGMWRFASRWRREWASFDLVCPHEYPAYIWVALAKIMCRSFPRTAWYCHGPDRTLYDDEFNAHYSFRGPTRAMVADAQLPEELRVPTAGGDVGPARLLPESARRRLIRAMDRRYIRSMDMVLANSHFTLDRLRIIYGRDLRVRPCVPGIPSTGRSPHSTGLGEDVLSLGRLLPSKNVDTVVRAVRLLVDRGKRVRLRIAGTGPHEMPLRDLTRRLGLDDHVVFLGELRQEEALADAFASARVLAYMSFDEPLGLVPLEAGLWSVPTVASNHGGPAETIVDGVNGLHADPASPESVADGLGRLLDDVQLASRLGEAMRERVLSEYTVARFAERFEAEVSTPPGGAAPAPTVTTGGL